MSSDVALQYDAAVTDNELGYYDDGTRRTLTDEQVAMFRHSEIEELLRERRLQRAEEGHDSREEQSDSEDEQDAFKPESGGSPASNASSLEDDLLSLTRSSARKASRPDSYERKAPVKAPNKRRPSAQRGYPPAKPRKTSISTSSKTSRLNGCRQQRRNEVPYDERHKRKWEDYIDENDPVHGSMTHRRIVRELDAGQESNVSIDYGEDAPASQPRASRPPPPPGRRVVSYDDDDDDDDD